MAIAHGGLRHLRDQRLRVAQQQDLHAPVAMELVLEPLAHQPVSVAGALDDRPARRRLAPHEQGDPDDAFVADHRNLRGRAVLHHVQERDDRIGWKVDMALHIAGLVQHFAEWHGNESQMRIEALALLRRKRCEQVILLRGLQAGSGGRAGHGVTTTKRGTSSLLLSPVRAYASALSNEYQFNSARSRTFAGRSHSSHRPHLPAPGGPRS